jgi:SanA protein
LIVLDYAGFRTLNNILRCRKVFRQISMTIISQPFYNASARFVAKRDPRQAIAFYAQAIKSSGGLKVMLQEKFAGMKKMLPDLMLGKESVFYGR